MKNENYLLNLHKIIPLWYEDVQLEFWMRPSYLTTRNIGMLIKIFTVLFLKKSLIKALENGIPC